MKRIEVGFFAIFREQAEASDVVVTTRAATVGEVFEELCAARPALTKFAAMKFALNDVLVDANTPVADGDRVLFFPPVAGG